VTKGKRYWIPSLKPMVMHRGFPEEVYDKCVAGMKWGYASLGRVAAHIAPNGTALPEMYVLRLFFERYPEEEFALGSAWRTRA